MRRGSATYRLLNSKCLPGIMEYMHGGIERAQLLVRNLACSCINEVMRKILIERS